jgi:hypothetical protein
MATKMSKEQLQWQAESDASTMARYQEIINDKARMNRAITEAKKQARDLQQRAANMQNATKFKGSGAKTTTKSTRGKK